MNRCFITSAPRQGQCPHCKRLTLNGVEEGFPYTVDPTPLTLLGELHAQLAGDPTYRLLADRIVRRTPENITAETPATRPPVYAPHHCRPHDPTHICTHHTTATQRLIAKAAFTEPPKNDQDCLISLADLVAGRIIQAPGDHTPPF